MKKGLFLLSICLMALISCENSQSAGGNKDVLGTRIDDSEAGPRFEVQSMANHYVDEVEDTLNAQESAVAPAQKDSTAAVTPKAEGSH